MGTGVKLGSGSFTYEVIEGWDERLSLAMGGPEAYRDKVAYFIPVKQEECVLGVLSTASRVAEKAETLRRIEAMQPLVDQVAIALVHARLYAEAQREMAERRRMEQELVRTQRLRAAGELSAGVSHNLNNILTSVLGPAQLLTRKTDDPEILREAEDIITAARRARDLVHRLHLSVRGEEEDQLQAVAVADVIREVVQVTRPRWKDEPQSRGTTIEVVLELEETSAIRGTSSRLHDIVTNLLLNAVDAMPDGGTITIRTQVVDEGVQLVFSDTGTGMDEDTRSRVFEPFFTTKMDVGSGLGLSTVHGTVTRWGGRIDVESAPGEGTTFTLVLPVWGEPEAREAGADTAAGPVRSGRVLIVEDDEDVATLLVRLLSETHSVEWVSGGRQALERLVAGRYDAVLVDLGMAGMAGDEVARRLRQVDAVVATVLITGWELGPADPRREAFDYQLQKPFDDLDEVGRVVAEAIGLHDARAAGNA